MKQVVVGSENPVKIEAVKQAFEIIWPDEAWHVFGTKTVSGVSDQPMSDEESIKGATNRARLALAHPGADFGVGLEGGLQEIQGEWFDCGWIVVLSKEGRRGIGSTIRIVAPEKIMDMIHEGVELGIVTDRFFQAENSKQGKGYFGLMTNDGITRTAGYRDGVVSALAPFLHPELF